MTAGGSIEWEREQPSAPPSPPSSEAPEAEHPEPSPEPMPDAEDHQEPALSLDMAQDLGVGAQEHLKTSGPTGTHGSGKSASSSEGKPAEQGGVEEGTKDSGT